MQPVRLKPGTRFGRLLVVRLSRIRVQHSRTKPRGLRACVMKCDCGRHGFLVTVSNLRSGLTSSCGCAQRDAVIAQNHANLGVRLGWREDERRTLTPERIAELDAAYYARHPGERDQ